MKTNIVKELSGVIRLKRGQDIKKDYTDYLMKKYRMGKKSQKDQRIIQKAFRAGGRIKRHEEGHE
jgi:hypothetical protein